MRLFVAVRPPIEVLDALDALPRPEIPGVRWTSRDQWHVTLRFLGNVDDPTAVRAALDASPLSATVATIGPAAGLLGRGVVQLPVRGLDGLAAVVTDTTASMGDPPETRRFRGHLTLARTKRLRVDTSELGVETQWPVSEIELIRSHLGGGGARYETLAKFPLRGC